MTRMILINLQKGFDTIKHKMLTEKMKCIGFSNDIIKFECLAWMLSFQENVSCKLRKHDKTLINCGLPQGSILEPLLFFLYLNDVVQAVNFDLLIYADDTVLFFNIRTLI